MSENNEKKLEYAVAWRDRYIRSLGDALAGREEEAALLSAFLKLTLERLCEKEREVRISKSEISARLERFRTEIEDEGDAYLIRFVPCKSPKEKERCDASEKNGDEKG